MEKETSIVPSHNNLDLLRLIFASMVVFAHCYDLSKSPDLWPLREFVSSGLAVEGFFILSGFLVLGSYHRSSSTLEYAGKRLRRLYPAYAFVVLCSAFFLFWTTDLNLVDYFNAELLNYVIFNLLFLNFLQPDLPGVFLINPTSAVNGALWTIKVEVCFYLALPIIVWFLRSTSRVYGLLLVFLLSYIYLFAMSYAFDVTERGIFDLLAKQLPGQMIFFSVGMGLYYCFDLLKSRLLLTAACGTAIYLASVYFDNDALKAIGVGLLIFSIAFCPLTIPAARFGDFSYAIYLVHFPIIQLFIWFGLFANSPIIATLLVYTLALIYAVFSWNIIEKRFLRR